MSQKRLEIKRNGHKSHALSEIRSTNNQSQITMGLLCFCAQAQKQDSKSEIYLAVSSFDCKSPVYRVILCNCYTTSVIQNMTGIDYLA